MKYAGLLILMFISLGVSAQSVFDNHTNSAIEKVIQDYPNRFHNIKGPVIRESEQSTNYESSIRIPGSLSCMVTRYSASHKEALYWKAELFEAASFLEARNKYKELFGQIKNSIIKIEGEKPYILNGRYEIPEEAKRSQSVVFSMLPCVGEMQKLKVELSLTRQSSSWKISLVIYDQDAAYGQALAADK